ncbi:WAS/WASL-interacting protein family member 2 isoform X2 [Sitodiplosis mosellana]|nr:WAS/WASL-interacting protein family member 2 isoform X2 [Sitodiplosis mosellana]XP_055316856.1 WAS/WASL-interacting protein family member 2 isoform X2 [Sitodiplosis mosellana]XP_055316857.1 WAS/WASL-interacting protein family member 2 isoform X2 [Sitodiplosis mosellana]
MAIPPPPPGPPGPPPPPIGNLKLGAPAFGKSSGGDPRSALLASIQQGAKLKKTTTVDKSGPLVSGRIADANSNNGRTNSAAPSRPPPPNNGTNGTLRGPFEGMSGMPKLKPIGGRTIGVASPTREPSSTSTGGSPQNTSNGTALDFSTELSQRIAMKNQKQNQQKSNNEMNTRNRGPPPQPPSKSVTDNNSSPTTTTNSSPLIKQSNSASPTSVSSNGANISILPNKSSLFGNSVNSNAIGVKTTATAMTTTTTNKVVPNYGKPTCAPKPPVTAKNGLNALTTTNNGNSTRSSVSRSQSVRAPRSPPISVAGSTFPQQFGTIRGVPAAFQSQDAINSVSLRPAPTINRPTVAPPRPPIEAKSAAVREKEQAPRTGPPESRSQGRTKSPPPPPKRSVSNTNLPALPLSVASSALSPNLNSISNSAAINFGGSASNVSTLMNNITQTANTGSANNLSVAKDRSPNTSSNSIAPPPPPPHRNCPAPPPPIRQTSITPNSSSNNNGAPPVPQRHSSMRNSNGAQATVVQHQASIVTSVTPNSTRTVTRFVMDLEAKFGHSFHNVTEFPPPQPFTKYEKSYPSRNMKATTEIRKAKAPPVPLAKAANSSTPTNEKFYLQLNQDDKLFTDESSYC